MRKFMFDTDFDAVPGVESPSAARAAAKTQNAKAKTAKNAEPAPPPAEPAPPPPPPEPTFSAAEVKAAADQARAEGQRAGEAKGRSSAMAEIEQRIATTLEAMAAQVTTLQAGVATDRQAILGDATTIALAMVKKMLPELTRRGGLAEIEAVLERCLQDQRKEPRLVARVSPDLVPALEQRLSAMTTAAGFEGRLFLIADERLGAADCTIEWADGGLERHADAIWREISAAFERCLTLQDIPLPTEMATPAAKAAAPVDAPSPDDRAQKIDAIEKIDATENDAGSLAAASDAEAMRSE